MTDPRNLYTGMLKAIECLQSGAKCDPELWTACYVFACSCIDALAKSTIGNVGVSIVAQIQKDFPDLDNAVGAKVFYDNFRCSAIHEFAMKPPYAIHRGGNPSDYFINGWNGTNLKSLNVERFVQDVIDHLVAKIQALPSAGPISTVTATATSSL